MAEACLRHLAVPNLKAYSCGVPSSIAHSPDTWTLLALQIAAISADNLRCKGWTEFIRSGSPKMDFVIALDSATVLEHPSWPGQPETALWDYPEIAENQKNNLNPGVSAIQTLHSLRRRIELFAILCSKGKTRSDLRDDLRDLAHL